MYTQVLSVIIDKWHAIHSLLSHKDILYRREMKVNWNQVYVCTRVSPLAHNIMNAAQSITKEILYQYSGWKLKKKKTQRKSGLILFHL